MQGAPRYGAPRQRLQRIRSLKEPAERTQGGVFRGFEKRAIGLGQRIEQSVLREGARPQRLLSDTLQAVMIASAYRRAVGDDWLCADSGAGVKPRSSRGQVSAVRLGRRMMRGGLVTCLVLSLGFTLGCQPPERKFGPTTQVDGGATGGSTGQWEGGIGGSDSGSAGGASSGGSDSGALVDGSSGASGTAGESGIGGAGGDGPVDPSCNVDEAPDRNGIFVSSTAGEAGNGSAGFPFKTLSDALELPIADRVIYLDQGSHEFPSLDERLSGLTVRGGWRRDGETWVRDCAPAPELRTRIVSSSAVGLWVQDAEVTLETLSIEGKEECESIANQTGESCYGLWIGGASAVTLRNVVVKAGKGGDGGLVTRSVAAAARSCTGSTLSCSSGAEGSAGDPGIDATEVGHFEGTGFVGVAAGDGEPGGEGAAGTAGSEATPVQCHETCTCSPGGPQGSPGICHVKTMETVTAGEGRCGCGGRGGAAGGGGLSGGASVGIFVADAASSLTIFDSRLVTADGGAGSEGAAGAAGGQGSNGAIGASAGCGFCKGMGAANYCSPCTHVVNSISGGAAGGKGGTGGPGGRGGHGPGGPSIGIVSAEGATIDLNEAAFTLGSGGIGPDSAADGVAQELLVF